MRTSSSRWTSTRSSPPRAASSSRAKPSSAVSRFVRTSGRALDAPLFAGSYLAVWALFGLAVYALYEPHGSTAAGALTIAAGLYELTPLKLDCRRRCQETVRSGVQFGVCCVGASVGLMVMLLALGVMSVAWTAVVAV